MKYVAVGIVLLFACVLLIPAGMTVVGSFMGKEESSGGASIIPRHPTLEAYVTVFEYPFLRWMVNSIVIFVAGFGLGLAVAIPAAYASAKYLGPVGRVVVMAVVVGIMVPAAVTTIPKFALLYNLGLYDSYAGLILPSITVSTSTWFLIKFMKAIPDDLIAMARLDGLGPLRILRYVIVPMTMPAIAALTALAAVGMFVDVLWPLLMIRSEELFTVSLGLKKVVYLDWKNEQLRMGTSVAGRNPAITLAGTTITLVIPVALFLFFQRYFIGGLFAKSTGGE